MSYRKNSEKLLGVPIYKKLNFNEYVSNLCGKASKKINALARIFPFIPLELRKIFMNAFFCHNLGIAH